MQNKTTQDTTMKTGMMGTDTTKTGMTGMGTTGMHGTTGMGTMGTDTTKTGMMGTTGMHGTGMMGTGMEKTMTGTTMMGTGMMGTMMTGTKIEECAKMCMDTAGMINKTKIYLMTTMKGDKHTIEMINMLTDCKETMKTDKMMKMCCDMMRQCTQMCRDTAKDTTGTKAQEYKQKIMECCQ